MDLLALLTFFLLCFLWHRHLSKPTNSKPSLPPKTVSPDKEGEIYIIDPETSLPKLVNSNDFHTRPQITKTAPNNLSPGDSSTQNKGNVIDNTKNGQPRGSQLPKGTNVAGIKVNTDIYKNRQTPIDTLIINYEKTTDFKSYCQKQRSATKPHVCFICGQATEAFNSIQLTIKSFNNTSIDVHNACYEHDVSELIELSQNGTVDVGTKRAQELKAHIAFIRAFNKGYPDDWESRRQTVLKRDGYRCQSCGRTNVQLDVHHILPLNQKGNNTLDNLQSLCLDCHESEHEHPLRINYDHYKQNIYEILSEAVKNNQLLNTPPKRVFIKYVDRNGIKSERIIRPTHFDNSNNAEYIWTFCEKKEAPRKFKLTRIQYAEFIDE